MVPIIWFLGSRILTPQYFRFLSDNFCNCLNNFLFYLLMFDFRDQNRAFFALININYRLMLCAKKKKKKKKKDLHLKLHRDKIIPILFQQCQSINDFLILAKFHYESVCLFVRLFVCLLGVVCLFVCLFVFKFSPKL